MKTLFNNLIKDETVALKNLISEVQTDLESLQDDFDGVEKKVEENAQTTQSNSDEIKTLKTQLDEENFQL